MIPEFNEHGYLPPGIHPATLEEIAARFGQSEARRHHIESLNWLVELARRAGIDRIIINGSFVTGVEEPIDVDCAVLKSKDFPRDLSAADELMDGLPYLHYEVSDTEGFDELVGKTFAVDRNWVPKGMIEMLS